MIRIIVITPEGTCAVYPPTYSSMEDAGRDADSLTRELGKGFTFSIHNTSTDPLDDTSLAVQLGREIWPNVVNAS